MLTAIIPDNIILNSEEICFKVFLENYQNQLSFTIKNQISLDHKFLSDYGKITPEESLEILSFYRNNPDFIIIDLRDSLDFEKGSISNSINIYDNDFSHIPDLSQKFILLYCYKNNRSKTAYKIISDKGNSKVYYIDSGFEGWQKAVFEFYKENF